MKNRLNEAATPAEQAKAMGLEYLGFGGWGHGDDRIVRAKTIKGKLVKVEDEEEASQEQELGRLIIIDIDDKLLYADIKNPSDTVQRYLYLLRALVRTGQDVILMHARNSEKKLATFLKQTGITSGVTLVPFGSSTPDKKRDFVEKKINEGYKEIQFFDRDATAIHAIESLKAPYNKSDISIETHKIPSITDESRATSNADIK